MGKKILFFYIASLSRGGAERAILQLARNFAMAGYRAIVVTNFIDEDEYPIPEGVERITIEQTLIVQSKLKRNLSRISALRRLCKEYRPEAIISFMREQNFRAVCATVGLPIKRIVSVRADPRIAYAGRQNNFIAQVIMPQADGCIFQTEDAKAWFPQKLQRKSIVVPNVVDSVFCETLHVGGQNIVTFGRLAEQKNHRLLIKAFAKIASEFPTVDLEIWGKGLLREELEEEIRALGMEKRIHLMGITNESAKVLSEAKAFVLSSNMEGMPNALMEALAVGVPCISTDCPCGGPRSLIRDGENGLLVPVGDEEALTIALRRVLRDENFARELGTNAKYFAEQYAPEKVFSQILAYIEGILGKRK